MKNGAPPHIACCVKQLLATIFVQFRTAWFPRYRDLNPCDFLLWRCLKSMVFHDSITSLSDPKESIERRVRNISQFILLSIVEHAILRFQRVAGNGGHHVEHVLSKIIYKFFKKKKNMLRHLGVIFKTQCFSTSIKIPSFHFAIIQYPCSSAELFLVQIALKCQV